MLVNKYDALKKCIIILMSLLLAGQGFLGCDRKPNEPIVEKEKPKFVANFASPLIVKRLSSTQLEKLGPQANLAQIQQTQSYVGAIFNDIGITVRDWETHRLDPPCEPELAGLDMYHFNVIIYIKVLDRWDNGTPIFKNLNIADIHIYQNPMHPECYGWYESKTRLCQPSTTYCMKPPQDLLKDAVWDVMFHLANIGAITSQSLNDALNGLGLTPEIAGVVVVAGLCFIGVGELGVIAEGVGTILATLGISTETAGSFAAIGIMSIGISNPPLNHPPVSNAGGPYSGTVGTSLILSGSATDEDGDVITKYFWDIVELKVNLEGQQASYTWNTAGTYHVTLTATDSRGATSAPSQSVVTISNIPPTKAHVTITTTPAGEIFINGTSVGVGNGGGDYEIGSAITVSFGDVAGYTKPASFTVTVPASGYSQAVVYTVNCVPDIRLNCPGNVPINGTVTISWLPMCPSIPVASYSVYMDNVFWRGPMLQTSASIIFSTAGTHVFCVEMKTTDGRMVRQCCTVTIPPDPVTTGTVVIHTTPSGTPWTTNSLGSGSGDKTFTNVPTGDITVTPGIWAGYITPAPQTQHLDAGQTITFNIVYTQTTTATVRIAANITGYGWSMDPSGQTGVGDKTLTNVAPGTITVTPGVVSGYVTPPAQLKQVKAGDDVTFSFTYSVQPIQAPTIDVTWPTTGYVGDDIAGTATPTAYGGATIVAGTVDYGDGWTANLIPPNIHHPYLTAGTYTLKVWVKDSNGKETTVMKTIVIAAKPSEKVVITSSSLPNAIVGQPYLVKIVATGGTAGWAITFSLVSGDVPPGMSLKSDGTITGTANVAGTYTFTVRATDAGNVSNFAEKTFSITCSFGSGNLTIITRNAAGDIFVDGTKVGNGTWNGTVSAGVAHTIDFGEVIDFYKPSGQVVNLTDGQSKTVYGDYVQSGCGTPFITITGDGFNSNATVGRWYVGAIGAVSCNSTGPDVWTLVSGSFPPGVTWTDLDPVKHSGYISGTPTQKGTYSFTVKVVDKSIPPLSDTHSFTVTVQ